jgi:hypothetical protein
MIRQAETYIIAMLGIFTIFVVTINTLPSMAPFSVASDKAESTIISLNETLRGCYAYASVEAWKNFYSSKISGAEGTSPSPDARDRFLECLQKNLQLIEIYNNWTIQENTPPDFSHSGSMVASKVNFAISKKDVNFNFPWEKSQEISIIQSECKIEGEIPNKFLEINFTLKGFQLPYVNVEIYILDANKDGVVLRKVFEGLLSPILIEQNQQKYTVIVPVELKYLASSGSIDYVVKVSDDIGACVWEEGNISPGEEQ